MATAISISIIQDRMARIGMTRADLVLSSGMSRTQIDRYLNGTVTPSVNAWVTMMSAVGLELDVRPSVMWKRAERAERMSRRAQVLEMQGAEQDPSLVTMELFLSERVG